MNTLELLPRTTQPEDDAPPPPQKRYQPCLFPACPNLSGHIITHWEPIPPFPPAGPLRIIRGRRFHLCPEHAPVLLQYPDLCIKFYDDAGYPKMYI